MDSSKKKELVNTIEMQLHNMLYDMDNLEDDNTPLDTAITQLYYKIQDAQKVAKEILS